MVGEVVEFERGPLHELESALRRYRGRLASEGEGEEVGGLIGADPRDEVIQSGDVVEVAQARLTQETRDACCVGLNRRMLRTGVMEGGGSQR